MGDHIFQNHGRPQGIAHTDVFPNNYELCIMHYELHVRPQGITPTDVFLNNYELCIMNCMCDHKGLPLQMYFPTITNYAL